MSLLKHKLCPIGVVNCSTPLQLQDPMQIDADRTRILREREQFMSVPQVPASV